MRGSRNQNANLERPASHVDGKVNVTKARTSILGLGPPTFMAPSGVNEIRKKRVEHGSPDGPDFTEAVPGIPRRAWILDSVKRPAEVKHLRRIYGDHLIVLGTQAGPGDLEEAPWAWTKTQRS